MRFLSSSAAAVAGTSLVLALASASHATVRPVVRTLGAPSRTIVMPRPAVQHPYAQQTPASCSAATPGPEALDSSFTFSTNKGAATFGSANLAAAGYAEALEGSGNTVCDYNSVIAGGLTNIIDSGSGNAPAGAAYSFIGAGNNNIVRALYSFLGAGIGNHSTGSVSFIGAGSTNSLSAHEGFIGAGYGNDVTGSGSFVGAGGDVVATVPNNEITGEDSFIGAGDTNVISANEAFVGSGARNDVSSSATYAGITSGYSNTASGEFASVLGGYSNKASGEYATAASGYENVASGELSFAGGYKAEATHGGSFVWSSYVSNGTALEDTAADQFVVRSSGGVYFYSNAGDTSGVKLGAGSGTWASLSDRNAKTDIASLDDNSILAKVAALPVSTWRYKSEAGVRHVGPMAQDFYAAFGVGEDNRHITSIDEDGVALAAIKALDRENAELRASQAALRSELHRFEAAYAPHKTD